MRRVFQRLARPLACATLVAAALPLAAAAAPADDYLAAKDKAVAAVVGAVKAGKNDEEMAKQEDALLKDLGARMTALLGPLTFKGLGAPAFSLEYLLLGADEPTEQLDGLIFDNEDDTTRLLVSPEPVFNAWLAARAKDEGAPAALGSDLKAAAATDIFYNDSVVSLSGGYTNYVELPLTAMDGETTYAALGLLSDEIGGNSLPNAIVIVRAAKDKVMVGITEAKVDIQPLAACDKLWAPYEEKSHKLLAAAEKDNKEDDPRWEQIAQIQEEGSTLYRDCFAKAAQGLPFFSAATKQAEALLATARGN